MAASPKNPSCLALAAPLPVQITHVNDHFTNSLPLPGEEQFAAEQSSGGGEGVRATAFEEDCEQPGERDDSDDYDDDKLQQVQGEQWIRLRPG